MKELNIGNTISTKKKEDIKKLYHQLADFLA